MTTSRPPTLLLLACAALASCASAPRTAFRVFAEPGASTYRSSWGAEGGLPATLRPPVEVGRQWFEVRCPGFHSQRVRFEFRDRREPAPFTASGQRLFGLDSELASSDGTSDLARDLSLDFEDVYVVLVPSDDQPVYTVDLGIGTGTERVRAER